MEHEIIFFEGLLQIIGPSDILSNSSQVLSINFLPYLIPRTYDPRASITPRNTEYYVTCLLEMRFIGPIYWSNSDLQLDGKNPSIVPCVHQIHCLVAQGQCVSYTKSGIDFPWKNSAASSKVATVNVSTNLQKSPSTSILASKWPKTQASESHFISTISLGVLPGVSPPSWSVVKSMEYGIHPLFASAMNFIMARESLSQIGSGKLSMAHHRDWRYGHHRTPTGGTAPCRSGW
jgi:hypothetical protein